MTIPYVYVANGDSRTANILFKGEVIPVSSDTNPNFNKIIELLDAGDEAFFNLVSSSAAVASRLEALTPRLSLKGSTLTFDGDAVDDAFTDTLVRFWEEGVEDWKPLAAFYENLYTNVTEDSRDNLARWVKAAQLTITSDGKILGYKGVTAGSEDGMFQSTRAGHGFVDGVEYNDYLPQKVGSVVTMPRSEVTWDPNVSCSAGLHVGTYEYARSFASVVLKVIVDPRDVVSVPTDYNGQKVRVARYTVDSVAETVVNSAVYDYDSGGFDEEDDWEAADEDIRLYTF